MRSKKSFRPAFEGELESRVVMSVAGGPWRRGPAPMIRALGSRALGSRAMPGRPVPKQSVVALTNTAFEQFTNEYEQARETYFSTLSAAASPEGATTARSAFQNYTTTRVDLLSQQVVSNVLQSPSALTQQKGSQPSAVTLVQNNLNGREQVCTGATATVVFRGRTLGRALIDTIPAAGTSRAAAELSALAQDQAIEAARVAVINGLTIIRDGEFGNKSKR